MMQNIMRTYCIYSRTLVHIVICLFLRCTESEFGGQQGLKAMTQLQTPQRALDIWRMNPSARPPAGTRYVNTSCVCVCLWVIFSLFIIITVYHFRLTSLHPKLLGGNDLAGGGLEDLALAPVLFDGLAGGLGEGVGLDGEVLGGELLAPDDDLVDAALGLGGGP